MKGRTTAMRKHLLYVAAIICVGLAGASSLAQTPSADAANGPDPREIPVPRIAAPLGTLPGVSELPTRTAMPDVLVMNDGTRVTTRRQWEHGARRCGASFVLRRRADAAGAGEREGPRDSVRARAGRHGQIPARPPDVRPRGSARARHRRVHAGRGRAVPRRDSAGRDASRRNGAAAAAAGPESGARRERAAARRAGAPAAGEPRRPRRRRAEAAVRPRRRPPMSIATRARGRVAARLRARAVQPERLRRGHDAAQHGRQLGVPQHALLSRVSRLRLGHPGGLGVGRLARRRLPRDTTRPSTRAS